MAEKQKPAFVRFLRSCLRVRVALPLGILLFGVGLTVPAIVKQAEKQRYPLISEQLVDKPQAQVHLDLDTLESRIDKYFADRKIGHSFYFEYLLTGTSIKSYENSGQIAASLLKLPFVMDMYKAAELNRLDLDQPVKIKQEWLDNRFGTLHQRGVGAEITPRQAAELALVESDNTANNLVKGVSATQLQEEEKILKSLDVKTITGENASIDAISYSSFLRCLYNVCYLNRGDSQELLGFLERNHFRGIADGVPKNIKIADKIGVAPDTHSDCGIVYLPDKPYILCVMLQLPKGQYEIVMKEVSAMVYEAVSKAGETEAKRM